MKKTTLEKNIDSINMLKPTFIAQSLTDLDFITLPDIIMPNKDFENAKNYVKTIDDKKVKLGIKDDMEPFVLITAFIQ